MTLHYSPLADPRLVQRAATFGFLAALLSSTGQTFFVGLFGAAIRAEFMLGEGAFGIVYGMATLASGLLMFWLGGLADRLDARRSITLSLLLLAAGALVIAFGQTIAWVAAVPPFSAPRLRSSSRG